MQIMKNLNLIEQIGRHMILMSLPNSVIEINIYALLWKKIHLLVKKLVAMEEVKKEL